jgi:hypothetical protein
VLIRVQRHFDGQWLDYSREVLRREAGAAVSDEVLRAGDLIAITILPRRPCDDGV